MRKILAVLALAACLPLSGYSVTSIMGGSVLEPGRFAVNASVNPFYDTNILTVADIGARVGLPGNLDLGLKLFWAGFIADLKYLFLKTPLSITLDAEISASTHIAFGGAVILDMAVTPYLALYLSGRLRYPVIVDIDYPNLNPSFGYQTGAVFLGRVGMELFRDSFISVNLEGGASASWRTPALGWTIGAMATWKI